MFDIGFAELLMIAVLGLLILGPERLPKAIRTVSLWLGRLRRSFNDIRQDIEREVGADEIRQQLHNESIMASLQEGKDKLDRDLRKSQQKLKSMERDFEREITGESAPATEADITPDDALDTAQSEQSQPERAESSDLTDDSENRIQPPASDDSAPATDKKSDNDKPQ
ncbi:twin-arginine translocase subunit TatB [Spongiibacter nanhainus]|uniref:Sec-independent protein translocase protein TatB n=1 Tax=Spongiibacter nanhainus TaxID=2794344 RepID=A0A7T4R209_9GAMM|nr:Sec-independent protein translocase protein TatB [Spongiibacter nanhainus]QQD18955.1 twin-arginine translocase subunit TatB [Spongiibacter nanhainus]